MSGGMFTIANDSTLCEAICSQLAKADELGIAVLDEDGFWGRV